MIKRYKTRLVKVGNIKIGAGNPIVVQSMTKVLTTDVGRCVRQIRGLVKIGCQLVRVAVPTRADTAAFAKIVKKVGVPLIADVHFSANRAIEAIEAGAAKIRLNPGNIKKKSDIERIIDAAKMHKIAVRIGVNEASIRDLKKGDVAAAQRAKLMLAEIKKYIRIFEKRGFSQLVLSAKSSDVLRTIEVNRAIAGAFDYPIHLGLTHAGLIEDALVPSSVSLGTLLAEGIGDTIRVSVAGNPAEEVKIAKEILGSLGLRKKAGPELIVCPTCGRAEVDVVKIARQIKRAISSQRSAVSGDEKPVRVAVMGCVVNGPGEAADSDLAVCCGKGKAFIYIHGRKKKVVTEKRIVPEVLKIIKQLKT